MAYDAAGLSLAVDLIGGKQRVWVYRTTDSVGTVDNTDYFAGAGASVVSGGRGMKVGDVVFVHKTDSPVVYHGYVSAVDADGNATWTPLEYASGQATTVTIDTAAGSTNEWTFTVTAKDAAGATVAGIQKLTLWVSEAATGAGTTADTYSTGFAAVTGTLLDFGGGGATATPNGMIHVLTDATGVFVGKITASAKPADQYLVCQKPIGAGFVVSAASGTNWG